MAPTRLHTLLRFLRCVLYQTSEGERSFARLDCILNNQFFELASKKNQEFIHML